MNSNKIEDYLALLAIRQTAMHRNAIILGGIFIVSFLSMIALGMLERLSGRSLYLVASITIVFGFAYLSTWIRLEVIKGSIELINALLLQWREKLENIPMASS
jgi:hypothetical protein